MTKIAINGFGRIGRNVLRALIESGRDDLRVVAINDPTGTPEGHAHLLRYDSTHGRFAADVAADEFGGFSVNGKDIKFYQHRNPEELPWGDLEVDIVLECTGFFTHAKDAGKHLQAGAKRVLISAPGADVNKTIVYGVNHDLLTVADLIVSNASCTTNCLAPVVKVLHEAVGILHGNMTTIHSYTGDQPILDAMHKDLYRARAAALNMIPTSTGAAKAVGLVLPELAGKLIGQSIRVPTANVSVVDLHFTVAQSTTAEELNAAITTAADGRLEGILGYTDEPLVSTDFIHNPLSSIFALDQTKVIGGTQCRIFTWYDNEWGFSCRMLDTAAYMGQLMKDAA